MDLTCIKVGDAAWRAGRFQQAREAFSRAVATPAAGLPLPELLRCHRLLAESLRELARYDAALEVCDTALRLIGAADVAAGDTRLERVRLMTTRGRALIEAGRASEAEEPLLEALTISPPENEVEGALALRALGEVRSAQARHAEEDQIYTRARATLLRLLPADHRERGHVVNSCGLAALHLGRLQEAETQLRQGLELRRSALPLDHPDVGESLHNLAAVTLKRARLDDAEALEREAGAVWERSLGPEHPRLALVLGNLGAIAQKRGQYWQAEELYRRGLAIREAALGPEHPRLIISINNIAAVLQKLERYEEAEALFRRSLKLAERAHGPDHPNVARALNNLYPVLAALEREEEGEVCLRRAIDIWERALGPESTELAVSLTNLASCQRGRGELDAAEETLLRVLSISQRRLGVDHPELATPLGNLADLYLQAGRLDQAEKLLLRSRELRERAGYRVAPATLFNLSEIARRQARSEDERDYLLQAIRITETTVGEHAQSLPLYLRPLSRALGRLGEWEAAVSALQRALDIQERASTADVLGTTLTLTALGGAQTAKGDMSGAENAYRRAIAIMEPASECEPGRLAELYILLGSLLVRTSRAAEARDWLERGHALASEALGPADSLVSSSLIWQGYAEIALGDLERAEKCLLGAFGCRDDGWQIDDARATLALYGLRYVYFESERPTDLTSVLERLVDLRSAQGTPDRAIAGLLRELADLRLASSHFGDAAELYRRVLAAEAGQAAFRGATAYYLAICLAQHGEDDEANERFSAAAAYFGTGQADDSVSLLHCLATWTGFLVTRERCEEAMRLAPQLSELAQLAAMPPHAVGSAQQALGLLHGTYRHWDEAEAALRKALTAWESATISGGSSGAIAVRHQLARLEHARGRHAAAEEAYLDLVRHIEGAGPPGEPALVAVLCDYALLLEQTARPAEASSARQRARKIAERLGDGHRQSL